MRNQLFFEGVGFCSERIQSQNLPGLQRVYSEFCREYGNDQHGATNDESNRNSN